MLTHFLGSEEVNAYNLDLVSRLRALGSQFPLQWFGLGLSGRKLIDGLLDLLPEREGEIQVGIANYNRATAEINFSDITSLEGMALGDNPILILDAAVHSGKTMLALTQKLQNAGAKQIMTYTLVLKRGALIIPTFLALS